ncbi:hypothetical protein [Candidatus Hecatella orcuttiae]|uniref:hypothetical protein n=1 Tax=Candidatus Hecatella orcuttiae TaxID=1935119 RepID=UPI002867C179|nr:hypothetical protein [Candidatus Hecatella orcuttiae]
MKKPSFTASGFRVRVFLNSGRRRPSAYSSAKASKLRSLLALRASANSRRQGSPLWTVPQRFTASASPPSNFTKASSPSAFT